MDLKREPRVAPKRPGWWLLALAITMSLLAACTAPIGNPTLSPAPASPAPATPALTSPAEPQPQRIETSIPMCDEVPITTAPAEWYRDTPIYVGNEQPYQQLVAWARGRPGFEEWWLGDHAGWVSLAFSEGAEERQAELEREFPGVGVVAVPVEWTMDELIDLQERVNEELRPDFTISSGIPVMQGVVSIGLGVMTDERLSVVEKLFAGERVCLEGFHPADAPLPGPQPQGGDGWRLLADEKQAGATYRTGIATDEESYEDLWAHVGLSADPPEVDFQAEVVIWFGAVYGGSCPDIRLDDVIVDERREPPMVYAEIVLVDPPVACTDDANPHAYVVALERDRLPAGPFGIQLDASDPAQGSPEERILIDVDLSEPGAVAGPDDIRYDPSLPRPSFVESGGIVETGFPARYRLYVHCGAEWLGILNRVAWRTEAATGLDWVPAEWPAPDATQHIEVWVLMYPGPEPFLEATANDHTVTYDATLVEPPGCD